MEWATLSPDYKEENGEFGNSAINLGYASMDANAGSNPFWR